MIKISKQNNSLIVEGIDNVFYPNNGDNSYPLNSLIVVTDNSDMATFRSVATNDVLFSGLIQNITINGEAVTKDNIIQKFDAVSNSSTGGGVDAYTKEEADTKFASKDELTNVQTVANDADTKVDALTPRVEGVETAMNDKQDLLVSGTNIKTVNSQSILGSGDLTISGVSEEQAQEIAKIPTLETEIAQKANVSDVPTVQTGYQGTNKKYIYSEGNIDDNNKTVVSNIVNVNDNPDTVKLGIYEWGGSMGKVIKLPSATTTLAGVMSAADKTKLDSIPETIPSQSEIDGIAADVSALETAMDSKQPTLVSGTNIKTINGESVLGEGNIEVAKKTDIPSTDNLATKDELTAVETVANNADAKADAATSRIESVETTLGNKQDTLVSGTNIKTINSQSILGEGNIEITGGDVDLTNYYTKTEADGKFATITGFNEQAADISALQTAMDGKQATLVSGENIKTINSESILGNGDIQINADAKVVKIGSPTPFIKLYDLLSKAVSALNNGTDYNETSYSFNETNNQQYLDLFKTLKNGDLLSQYDTIFGDMFKVECNPYYFNTSEGTNNFDILIKYLGNFNSTNFINYTRDIHVYVYFYKSSNGVIDEVELQVHTKKAGPTLQKNDFKTINGESLIGEGNIAVSGVSEEQAQEIAKIPTLETSLGNKQDILVSGTNIKTINNQSILGEGNLEITGGDVDLTNYYTKTETDTKLGTKQNTLVSGTNIKTINGESVLGEGNLEVTIPDATTATSGAMSAADKTKLDSISTEWTGTQAEYDALATKDNNTIYYVTE